MNSATNRKNAKNQAGFTVVEVMIASAIMVISVLTTLSALSYARRTVSRTENRLACLHIAREVMETLRAESYNSDVLEVGTNKRPIPKHPLHPPNDDDREYYSSKRGYYDVVEHVSDEEGARKDITVVIEWEEPADGYKTLSVSLTTSHSKGLHP